MIYEVVVPKEGFDHDLGYERSYYHGITSIPSKSIHSDMIFEDESAAALIRPVFPVVKDSDIGAVVDSASPNFAGYVSKIKEWLLERKKIEHIYFMDFRISKTIKHDVEVNYSGFIADNFIDAILVDIWAATYDDYICVRNNLKDMELVKAVSDISSGIHAFQLILSDRLFDPNDKASKGMCIFQHTQIYSSLAMEGKISGKIPEKDWK